MGKPSILHIDFESRSTVDLQEVGLDNYARHSHTDIWCMAYAFDDESVDLWVPGLEGLPDRIREHVRNGLEVIAHNVSFELALWNAIVKKQYGGPSLLPSSCSCTMTMAYNMALPGALDTAAAAVGLGLDKDQGGRRIMLQMCRPRTEIPLTWWDTPEKLASLYAYCKQDVEVERQLYKKLLPLSAREKRVWLLDYTINNTGIGIDLDAVKSAMKLVEYEQKRLNDTLRVITGGAVSSVTEVAGIKKWARSQGVDVVSLSKADVIEVLMDEMLPDSVREVLSIRQEAGRSSISKLSKILSASSLDLRLRNTLQYYGANTGRWAGRLVQVHNLPKPKIKSEEIIDEAFKILRYNPDPETAAGIIYTITGSVSDVLVSMLRGMFVAEEGSSFIAGDFSNIEGRMLAWEAGENWKLKAFSEYDESTGPDLYKLAYGKSFGIPTIEVSNAQRDIGKVMELACGYQGGVGAFQTMARVYNVTVSDEKAEKIKNAWREAHPAIVSYWKDVEQAAIAAILNPGLECPAGPKGRQVIYLRRGSFLMCKLPSQRVLFYPYPELREVITPWGSKKEVLTYKTVPSQTAKLVADSANTAKWARVSTYGGKLVENVTQALARDILADAMLRLDEAGFKIVLHVHDEIVSEMPSMGISVAKDRFCDIMAECPPWAIGLPISVKSWHAKRYKKD